MVSEKNKVGIITLYHDNHNFGGLLQAYALTEALKNFGVEAEQIDYVLTGQKEPDKQMDDRKESLFSRGYHLVYHFGFFFFSRINQKNLNRRKQAFNSFINDIPHSAVTYEAASIQSSLERYQCFICGGDQIWNDYRQIKWYSKEDSEAFTLQFVPEHIKTMSYAPSMAVLEITPDFKRLMRSGLKRLNAISVREKKSVSVLQPLTDRKIEVVVDPVLLMTVAEWSAAARPPQRQPRRYILCYLLGDNVEQRKASQKIAKKMHLPLLTFPHILLNIVRKSDLFFGDIGDFTSGPREFISLIQNAEFVITDSFHACVFSMIFKTPFAVFERNKAGETGNMNSRIYDFLEEYHLEEQLVTEKDLVAMKVIPEIDFTYAHEHWKKRREESLEYLEKAFEEH